ncbi:MAG: endonuclease/exonuclease/phosphatase family protein [Deltaproteobacteria bacterium]|nr:endonuclease/exonuclease/phosphatase family protein [Deltaproteobacteria bacterium]
MRLNIHILWVFMVALSLGACRGEDTVSPDGSIPPDRGPAVDRFVTDLTIGPPVKVVVATFNVRNFFDSQDDPDTFDDVESASAVSAKVRALGTALRALDADIVALQEIETLALLERLNGEELGSLGYTEMRLLEGNDLRGIDVALLSRHPIISTTSHARDIFDGVDVQDTDRHGFSRDCLEVVVEPSPARRLVLLINHLRAADYSDPQDALFARHAQAARVRQIADSTLTWEPNANLAVLGDLNDVPESRTLSLLTLGDPPLKDLHDSLSMSQRYTYIYKGDQTVLDYILASPGLVADLEAGSARTNHSSVFSTTSDHFPVLATFMLR